MKVFSLEVRHSTDYSSVVLVKEFNGNAAESNVLHTNLTKSQAEEIGRGLAKFMGIEAAVMVARPTVVYEKQKMLVEFPKEEMARA